MADPEVLKAEAVKAMRTLYDPEIPLNIYDFGLIYDIAADPDGNVTVKMTLTSPTCFAAQTLPGQVHEAVSAIPGVKKATVDLVWEPPWSMARLSESAKLQLGLM